MGAFEGIATVEDIVEEVVGDIRDEFDADEREPSIDRRDDGAYIVDGGVPLDEVNETLETAFQIDEFGTIGGLVLDHLGRAPVVGDRIAVDGYVMDVAAVDGARISTVVVREAAAEEESTA